LREAGTVAILFALDGVTLKDGGIVTIVVSGVAAPLGEPSVSIVDYPALAPSTPVEKPATLPKTGESVGLLGWLLTALAAIVAGSVLRRAVVAQ
jgi:hypothetical protein